MSSPKVLADVDSAKWPDGWRDDWEFKENSCPMPRAWHRSGLCFFFEFEQVDEQGTWSWVVWDDDISQSRLEELRAELGDELFFKFTAQLGRQAKARWHELGYNDWSLPTGVPRPADHGGARSD